MLVGRNDWKEFLIIVLLKCVVKWMHDGATFDGSEVLLSSLVVRLFAAEDAPSLLGTSVQELYQAKETKFLHAAKPVSESDLPPGFVNFAARQTGSGADLSLGMDSQVQWCCPEKFLLRLAWQVATGSQSMEVFAEQSRQLGVPEATYPHLNLIPASPGEPPETAAEAKVTDVPEIPVFSVDDEDELEEGFNPGGDVAQNLRKGAVKTERPGSVSSGPSTSSLSWSAGQVDQGANSICMSNADPNVAAAAAAAYAVLKAKERGTLVDHDLLIKILTNPILIKTLLASKQSVGLQLRDLPRAASEGVDKDIDLGRSVGNTSLGSNLFGLPVSLGSKTVISASESMPESTNFHAWNASSHIGSSRPFLASRADDNFFARTEMQGMGFPPSQMLPNRQDAFKDLMHQHGLERSRIEGLSRGLTEMDFMGSMKPLSAGERHRPVIGPFSQVGPGSQHGGVSVHGRGDGFPSARYGGEQSQSRFQKPCIYFNTPKGCRRGTSCFYLHNSASEQPYNEQPRTDFFQFQAAKRQKFGVPERE
ncbi:hypothetical protein GOP47_0022870 [Adiantum capillus-veneris]|uniref:C3H1-type domain-containing protein n=1 Tax=Adiantum capillus-veneris TaxID=13818 RepID=A0A9D4U691_ADICA|nr:hypothetical protein GOP47_0022870 [Adiantum capillus-veneris]